MAINFNSFTTGTVGGVNPIQSDDFVVGFDTAVPSGERKWQVTTLANAISGVMSAAIVEKINQNLSSTLSWKNISTTYTAINNDKISANTSSAAFTITLPSSPTFGTNVTFVDHAGTWDTNNLTIATNGQTIEGLSQNLVCNVVGDMVITVLYNGSTWKVYA